MEVWNIIGIVINVALFVFLWSLEARPKKSRDSRTGIERQRDASSSSSAHSSD